MMLTQAILNVRCMLGRMVNSVGGLDEIGLIGIKDVVDKFLGIAVDERKPTALYLDHNAVAVFEGVQHVLQRQFNIGNLARGEGFRFVEVVAIAPAKHLAADHLLVMPHADVGWIVGIVWMIARINVYQLDHPVCIRSAGRHLQPRHNLS